MVRQYLRYSKSMLFSALMAIFIFSAGNVAFHMSTDNILYCTVLYLFVVSIWICFDFMKFYQKIRLLGEIERNLTIYSHDLPAAQNAIEEKYGAIIVKLYREVLDKLEKKDADYHNTLEYYTLWVHQIKTPIAAMRLVIDDIVLEQELFKIEQYVELALSFVKIEKLQNDLVIGPYHLGDMIRQCIKKYSLLFIHKGLSVDMGECDFVIMTDSKWFSFVIEQLLSNAAKYTQEGAIRIHAVQEDKRLHLSIADCGIGIKQEDMERIFEKGYTGFNGRLDKKASGIGLYLVKKVTDALGYEIAIDSELHVGTTVHVFVKNL